MTIFYILLALAVVIFSADMMVKGAVITANKIGVPPIIIGLTIIAFGTSAPELMVTIEASLTNNGSIVIGNIVGSNIANIVLVLSVACIIMPLRFSKANISEALLLIFATLLLLLGLYYAHIPLWLGILMLASQFGFIIYRYYTLGKKAVDLEELESAKASSWPLLFAIFVLTISLATLLLSVKALIFHGVVLATQLGVSEAVIAITLFALGTSLPEVATAIACSRQKQGDVIIGAILGSNIMNILTVGGVAAVIAPLSENPLSTLDLAMFALSALILAGSIILASVWGKVHGGILLVSYTAYVILQFS